MNNIDGFSDENFNSGIYKVKSLTHWGTDTQVDVIMEEGDNTSRFWFPSDYISSFNIKDLLNRGYVNTSGRFGAILYVSEW